MKFARLLIGCVFLAGCVASLSGSGSLGGSTSKGDVASSTTKQAVTGGDSAKAPPKLDDRGFYTITTIVDGEEVAITFVPPQGTKVLTNNASKARVEARKVTKEETQLWQPYDSGAGDYVLYTKVMDIGGDHLSGVMAVYRADPRMAEDDAYQDTYNRVSVGPHTNETSEYWKIE